MKFPPPFCKDSRNINAIIETPKGSGNKYAYDPDTEMFKLSKILPEGLVFPLHFGFIPGTKADDGDPLDVLVFLDAPSYPGCIVECKLLGVIEAEEKEKGKKERNDRLVAAAVTSHRYGSLNSLKELDKEKLKELVRFFVNYNKLAGKKFKPLGNKGPKKAHQLIEKNLK